jgi:hypothetical protein
MTGDVPEEYVGAVEEERAALWELAQRAQALAKDG